MTKAYHENVHLSKFANVICRQSLVPGIPVEMPKYEISQSFSSKLLWLIILCSVQREAW